MVDKKETKAKKVMTTIWIEKSLTQELRKLGTMDDNYSTVIRRLLNGCQPAGKGEPHEDRGVERDESARVGHHQEG